MASLLCEATISDPDVFTRPTPMRFALYRRARKDVRLDVSARVLDFQRG